MTIIQQMINKYNPKTLEDKKHAIKEVLQEVVLAGLLKLTFAMLLYDGTTSRILWN